MSNVKAGKLDHKHKITPETDLFNYPFPFDPEFWKNYNAPLQTEEEKRIKQELERNGVSLQNQFNTKQ